MSPAPGVAGSSKEVRALAVLFWAAVAWSAVRPVHVTDYVLEIAVPVGGMALLAGTRRRFPFTALSYRLMFLEGLVLAVGAHYTHEKVPLFDWLKPVFGWERNHYDRFAHFCVGLLLVIPVREILRRTTPLRGPGLQSLSVVGILAFAGFYEVFEWWVAVLAAPGTAEAYLGSQGDSWDAQKDMLLDTVGAAVGLLFLSAVHDRQLGGTPLRGEIGAHYLRAAVSQMRRLKSQAERALAQVPDEGLHARLDAESNSIAVLMRHMAGNMASRWTDFLTTDGEKPSRDRDGEFDPDVASTREELDALWERGWACVFGALDALRPEDLMRTVAIRGAPLSVVEAIERQLTHYGEHVGQIVLLAKHLASDRWQTLSIPRNPAPGGRRGP